MAEQAIEAVQRVGDLPVDRNDDGDFRHAVAWRQRARARGERCRRRGGIGARQAEPVGSEEGVAGARGADRRIVHPAVVRICKNGVRMLDQLPRMACCRWFEPAAALAGPGLRLRGQQPLHLRIQIEQAAFLAQ